MFTIAMQTNTVSLYFYGFAQLRFGQSCQFQWVTLDEVISGKKARERHIQRVKNFAEGK